MIEMSIDPSGGYHLTDQSRAIADAVAPDGTLLAFARARELFEAGEADLAQELLLLVHYRGLELGSPALRIAALNVSREGRGLAPIPSTVVPS